MRTMTIHTADFVLCRSDRGDGGWSLHAPGSTDEEIANGDAPPLVSDDEADPTPDDYREAAEKLAPWAAEVIEVDGGYMAFESVEDAKTWESQT